MWMYWFLGFVLGELVSELMISGSGICISD